MYQANVTSITIVCVMCTLDNLTNISNTVISIKLRYTREPSKTIPRLADSVYTQCYYHLI